MNGITKLTDLDETHISRGTVFRLPAKWPYEDIVEFMIYETLDESRPFGLIVTTGYKAGLILVELPPESVTGEANGLSTTWVIDNWSTWIYPDSPVDQVRVFRSTVPSALDEESNLPPS
ncbi:Imm45 family immunity protein [Nocardia sp. NPDC060256]|uniref:Imm45 family immunity protein n=1 Tax=unclassified Nocardia TaxID=2637762 RepID=UPI0036557DCE